MIHESPIVLSRNHDPADKARHDRTVGLVETMLKLHKDSPKAKTPHEQESRNRTIVPTDRQIGQHAHELYGLTDEGIRIVQAKGS